MFHQNVYQNLDSCDYNLIHCMLVLGQSQRIYMFTLALGRPVSNSSLIALSVCPSVCPFVNFPIARTLDGNIHRMFHVEWLLSGTGATENTREG